MPIASGAHGTRVAPLNQFIRERKQVVAEPTQSPKAGATAVANSEKPKQGVRAVTLINRLCAFTAVWLLNVYLMDRLYPRKLQLFIACVQAIQSRLFLLCSCRGGC